MRFLIYYICVRFLIARKRSNKKKTNITIRKDQYDYITQKLNDARFKLNRTNKYQNKKYYKQINCATTRIARRYRALTNLGRFICTSSRRFATINFFFFFETENLLMQYVCTIRKLQSC